MRDEPRSGGSSDLDQDASRELVKCNLDQTTQGLALDFNTSQSKICRHLKKIEKVSKLGVLVSHTPCEKNKEDFISIMSSLLSRKKNYLFLKNIITSDEKWVFYHHVQCRRRWVDKDESLLPTPKVVG